MGGEVEEGEGEGEGEEERNIKDDFKLFSLRHEKDGVSVHCMGKIEDGVSFGRTSDINL